VAETSKSKLLFSPIRLVTFDGILLLTFILLNKVNVSSKMYFI
jgi:hypothetical protein